MQEKQLRELKDDEITKKWKETKSVFFLLLGVLIITMIAIIYSFFVNGFQFEILSVPFLLGFILFNQNKNFKAIKAEMKARNLTT